MLRRRPGWPLDRFSTVERAWAGGTVVCIGGGPSLTADQCAAVAEARARSARLTLEDRTKGAQAAFPEAAQVRVIAVNDAYRLAPWADVCYFADSEWWVWHKDRPEFRAFAGERCSIQNSGANIEDAAVHLLRNRNFPNNGTGLSLDGEYLVTGGNSGFQAVNLAVLAGARTLILLGYDGREPASGKPGHWFGEHPRIEPRSAFALYRQSFKVGAAAIKSAGVRVLNCSPGSAIDAFERMDLAEALCLLPDPLRP